MRTSSRAEGKRLSSGRQKNTMGDITEMRGCGRLVLAAVALLLTASSTGAAQGVGGCRTTAHSTADIEACAAMRLRTAERGLRVAELRAQRIAGQRGQGRVRQAAQRWSQYRQAECRAVYLSYDGGSGATAAELNCKATLTEARTSLLRRIYSEEG